MPHNKGNKMIEPIPLTSEQIQTQRKVLHDLLKIKAN
jgi:hypothetical protein